MKPNTTSIPTLIAWLESRDFGAHGVYGLEQRDAAQICQALSFWSERWSREWAELCAFREGRARPTDPTGPENPNLSSYRVGVGEAFNAGTLARIADALAVIAQVQARRFRDETDAGAGFNRTDMAGRIAQDLLNRAVKLLDSSRPPTE